jgi:hypothetical protein
LRALETDWNLTLMTRLLRSLFLITCLLWALPAPAHEPEEPLPEELPDAGAPEPENEEEAGEESDEPPPWTSSRIDDDTEDRAGRDHDVSLRIRRARARLDWRPNNRVTGRVLVGAERVDESPSSLLRDAFFDISPRRRLTLRAGQFKKPFSGLELRSPARAQVMRRGNGSSLIVDDLRYGDRDLGLQLRARLLDAPKVDAIIGLFNGSGPEMDFDAASKDAAGRLELRPWPFLTLGINASFKFFSDDDIPVRHTFGAGADARLALEGFTLHLEALRAENHLAFIDHEKLEEAPNIVNGVAYVSYRRRIPRAHQLALEPMFKLEVLDPKLERDGNEVLGYTPGMILHLGRLMRLMVYAEIRDPGPKSGKRYAAEETMMVEARLFL